MSQGKATTRWNGGTLPLQQPDREVVPRAQRRRFSAGYKLRILQEAEQCKAPGEVGALLRREGLYSSHLSDWRRERAAGQLQVRSSTKPGRKADEQAVMAALQRENEQLKAQLAQAELIIAAQKKLALALEQAVMPNKEKPS
jgi:transposase